MATKRFAWDSVGHVIENDAPPGAALAFARRLAAGPTRALALAKRAINEDLAGDIARARDTTLTAQLACFGTRDFAEGVNALADRRSPRFIGK